jgi:hypothetical protein
VEVTTMKVGRKAQGSQGGDAKFCIQRHGHSKPRSYNRCEKAIETKLRQQGKKAARER